MDSKPCSSVANPDPGRAARHAVEWLSAEVGFDRRTGDWVLAGPLLPPRAEGLTPDPAHWAALVGR